MRKLLCGLLLWMLTGANLMGQSVFINEVNYLLSIPTQGMEVVGPAGQDMTGWDIVTYNILGGVESTEALSGTIPNQDNGYGAIWYDVEQGFVGSVGGGAALVDPSNDVVHFVSYGPLDLVIAAVEGVASGKTSEYIGLQNILNFSSLQLTGTGNTYTDFVWGLPSTVTQGAINTDQFFSLLLPIELSGFQAEKVNQDVEISWTTQSEINLDYFELERSTDGRVFYPIYQTEGRGTEDGPQTYRYLDRSPAAPTVYYRLRNVDLDGSSGLSKMVVVSTNETGIRNIYQVPGNKKLIIEYYPNTPSQNGILTLFDTSGRVLRQFELQTKANTQEIDLSQLNIGAYFIRINLGGNTYARLIINE